MSVEQIVQDFIDGASALGDSIYLVFGFALIPVGYGVVSAIVRFISELPPVQITIPTRKVIKFKGGIYKKGSNTLTCSCCSANYDMNDIKIKFDQQGYFDCQCGEELCRLVLERVL